MPGDFFAHFAELNANGSLFCAYDGMMRTYLIRDVHSSELAGYFSIKAGLISINETTTENGVTFDTIPG
ncbi:MAG: hypothetical protein J6W55_04950, partial [Acidaminococcaceae bacterium]|nr:hypothetical protein [Acidaminococcaceae bacterium]